MTHDVPMRAQQWTRHNRMCCQVRLDTGQKRVKLYILRTF